MDTKLCLIAAAAAVSCTAAADTVSIERAVNAARAWAMIGTGNPAVPTGETRTFAMDGKDAFHLVALSGGGFVALPTDDGVDPILGFTESGELPDEDDGSPLWTIIAGSAGLIVEEAEGDAGDTGRKRFEVRAARVEPAPPARAARRALKAASAPAASASATGAKAELTWERLDNDEDAVPGGVKAEGYYKNSGYLDDLRVRPLLETAWGQADRGLRVTNYYTPGNVVCGCCALAMAQVMRYHRYPDAAHPVEAFSRNVRIDGVWQSRTAFGGTYEWNEMADNPPTEQRAVVSKICYDAGISMNMRYAAGGSSAKGKYSFVPLKSRFSFQNADSVTVKNNTALLKKSLLACVDAGYPCIVTINNHILVGDGYGFCEGSLYCHLNMGWWGSQNWWFLQPANPDASRKLLEVVYNIFPSAKGELATGRVLNAEGRPVAGAKVEATIAYDGGETVKTATTDYAGIYAVMTPKAACTVHLVARCGGFESHPCTASVTASTSVKNPNLRTWTDEGGTVNCGNSWGNDIVIAGYYGTAAAAPVFAEYDSTIDLAGETRREWSLKVDEEGDFGSGRRCRIKVTDSAGGGALELENIDFADLSADLQNAELTFDGAALKNVNRLGTLKIDRDTHLVFDNGARFSEDGCGGTHWIGCVGAGTGIAEGTVNSIEVKNGSRAEFARSLAIGGGAASSGRLSVAGGDVTVDGFLYVGHSGPGELEIDNGGSVSLSGSWLYFSKSSSSAGMSSRVRLGEGELTVRHITYGAGSGGAAFVFDGGTLKADGDNDLTKGLIDTKGGKIAVTVTPRGGAIDTAALDEVRFEADVAAGDADGGALAVKGGGTLAMSGTNTYTGATTVASGTMLKAGGSGVSFAGEVVFAEGAALAVDAVSPAAVSAAGFVVPQGTRVKLTGSRLIFGANAIMKRTDGGVFAEGDLDRLVIDASALKSAPDPEAVSLRLSADGKSVVLQNLVAGDAVYIGEAGGDLGVAENWSTGRVPAGGNAVIASGVETTLTVSGGFAPDSITFPEETKKITLVGADGAELSGIRAITNLSTVIHHDFQLPVKGGKVDFYTLTYCTFSGGITVANPVFGNIPQANYEGTGGRYFSGSWTITGEGLSYWNPYSYGVVLGGATLEMKQLVKNPMRLTVYAGGRVRIDRVVYTPSEKNSRLFYKNDGFISVGELTISGSYDSYAVSAESSGEIEVARLVCDSKYNFRLNGENGGCTWIVGEGGISHGSNATEYASGNVKCNFLVGTGKSATLKSAADWTFEGNKNVDGMLFLSGSNNGTLTIDTADAWESGTKGHTVTFDGWIYQGVSLNVTGNGTLALDNETPFRKGTAKPLHVKDSSALRFNAPCLGAAVPLTMDAGTTLAFEFDGETPPVRTVNSLSAGALNIVIDGPVLADGSYELLRADGGVLFAASSVGGTAIGAKTAQAYAEDGKMMLKIGPYEGRCVWVNSEGGVFSDPANWLGGKAPVAGSTDDIVITDSGADLRVVNDIPGLTPKTISLVGDSRIYLGGEKFTDVEKVVNTYTSSDAYRDFITAPVEFKGAITLGGNMWVQFGDAKGTAIAFDPEATSYAQKGLRGNLTITGDWSPDRNLTIGDGVVTVQGTLSGSHRLTVNSGGTLKAAAAAYSSTALLAGNAGMAEFGVVTASGSGDYQFYNGGASNGVVVIGKFINNAASTVRLNNALGLVMGEGGFAFGPNTAADQGTWKSFSVGLNTTANIWPSADFTFATNSYATTGDPKSPGNTRRDFMQGFNTINNVVYGSKLNVYTTDYYDGTVARTVTVDGCFYCAKASNEFNVRGIGTVVVNSYWSNYPGKVGVYDTATLQINPGCRPGASALSMANGTCLSLPLDDGGNVAEHTVASFTQSGGIRVKIDGAPLADGEYTVLSATSAMTALPAKIVPGGTALAGKAVSFAVDGKNLKMTVSSTYDGPDSIWTGAKDSNLLDSGNWLGGVPTAGNGRAAIIGTAESAVLACDGEFDPVSITFPAGSAKVTIAGEGSIAGILAITNLSPVMQEFKIPVSGGTVDIYNSSMYCRFSGGFTVVNPVLVNSPESNGARGMSGRWTIMGEGWVAIPYSKIQADSTIYVSAPMGGGALQNLFVSEGSTFRASEVKLPANGAVQSDYIQIGYRNDGTVEFDDLVAESASAMARLAFAQESSGILRIGKFTDNAKQQVRLNDLTFVMGAGGFAYGADSSDGTTDWYSFSVGLGLDATIWPSADYTIGMNGNDASSPKDPSNTRRDFGIGYSNSDDSVLIIQTSDYDDRAASRKVTVNGVIYSNNSSGTRGKVRVCGCGEVVFNSYSRFGRGITVEDTATLSVNAGCAPGVGTVTMNAGTTLALPEHGTVTLGGRLTLAPGTSMEFKVDGAENAVLAVPSLTLNATGANPVKVRMAAGSSVRPGKAYTLLSGGGLAEGDETKFALADGDRGALSASGGDLVYRAPRHFSVRIR